MSMPAIAATHIEIVGDAYPPFIQEKNGTLAGPFVDAFDALLREHGIEAHYSAMPTKRIMELLPSRSNTCALAIHFSPGWAETVTYVGRVAPITLSVYARRGGVTQLGNIENLRQHSVGAIDIAEVRDLLGTNSIPYNPIPFTADGMKMLEAHRFELLISDSQLEFAHGSNDVVRIFTLARLERWLACQQAVPSTTLGALRMALKEGVYAKSTRPIWERYQMSDFYEQVRHQWDATQKTP
jgi:hypothetical protein